VRRAEKREANARRKAFAALHEEHASGIYNLALRFLGNREDAQDVSQDVLLKAYQRLGKPGELNQRAWLYRVTVNACYDHLRARKRKPAVPWEPELVLDFPSTIDRYEQAELRRQLEEAFRRVPPAQRVALLLREIHGLPVGEVAFALGVKPSSAEVTLVRARRSFRRHFGEISERGGRWAASAASEQRGALKTLKGSPHMGGFAAALGLPALALHGVPLPASLDVSSLLAAAPASIGLGGGAVAGVVAKIAAALSTKAAVVAIGATVVAGSAGGLYTVERSSQVAHRPYSQGAATRPSTRPSPGVEAGDGEVAVAPASMSPAAASSAPDPQSSASGSPSSTPSPSPTPLVVGESGGSPSSTPAPSTTPTDTASPAPSPTPSQAPSPDPVPSTSPAP
jgi:RNA polymerase sigma factor (sigma-70 family)